MKNFVQQSNMHYVHINELMISGKWDVESLSVSNFRTETFKHLTQAHKYQYFKNVKFAQINLFLYEIRKMGQKWEFSSGLIGVWPLVK